LLIANGKVINNWDSEFFYFCKDSMLPSYMGQKARSKCIEKYSFDVMEKVLVEIFQEYE